MSTNLPSKQPTGTNNEGGFSGLLVVLVIFVMVTTAILILIFAIMSIRRLLRKQFQSAPEILQNEVNISNQNPVAFDIDSNFLGRL